MRSEAILGAKALRYRSLKAFLCRCVTTASQLYAGLLMKGSQCCRSPQATRVGMQPTCLVRVIFSDRFHGMRYARQFRANLKPVAPTNETGPCRRSTLGRGIDPLSRSPAAGTDHCEAGHVCKKHSPTLCPPPQEATKPRLA